MTPPTPRIFPTQDPRTFAPLAAYQRSGITEVVIHGSVIVMHGDKILEQRGGDFLCFGRSLLKPFQMKVFARDFASGVSIEAQAVSVASHNAEPRHLKAAREFLNSSEPHLSPELILTPASLPLVSQGAAHPGVRLSWNHPCSGKHAAILRGCAMRGWPLGSYLSCEHPYHGGFFK